jgi:hypothetical protein
MQFRRYLRFYYNFEFGICTLWHYRPICACAGLYLNRGHRNFIAATHVLILMACDLVSWPERIMANDSADPAGDLLAFEEFPRIGLRRSKSQFNCGKLLGNMEKP